MLTKDDYQGIEKVIKKNLRGFVRHKDLLATERRLLRSINRLTDSIDNRLTDVEDNVKKLNYHMDHPPIVST